MAYIPQATNQYVKFVRATQANFTALETKQPDTLYFVQSDDGYELYLGASLVAGGSDVSAANLDDLADVLIASVSDKQLLVYDATSEKWKNASIQTLIGTMVGASTSQNGASGLVPAPAKADVNKYLKGDGSWATINADDVIDTTQAQTGDVLSVDSDKHLIWAPKPETLTPTEIDSRIATAISGIASIHFTKVDALPTTNIDSSAIYLVPKDGSAGTNDNYVEWVYVNDGWEKMGETGSVDLDGYVTDSDLTDALAVYAKTADLNSYVQTSSLNSTLANYVTATDFNSTITGLGDVYITQAAVGDLSALTKFDDDYTLVDQVNDLSARLTWYNLVEE